MQFVINKNEIYTNIKIKILSIRVSVLLQVQIFKKFIIYLVNRQIPIGIIIHEKYFIFKFVTLISCLILIIPFSISLIYITAMYPFIE